MTSLPPNQAGNRPHAQATQQSLQLQRKRGFGIRSREPPQPPAFTKTRQPGIYSAGSLRPSLGPPTSTEHYKLSSHTTNSKPNSKAKAATVSVTTMPMQTIEPTANFHQGKIEEIPGDDPTKEGATHPGQAMRQHTKTPANRGTNHRLKSTTRDRPTQTASPAFPTHSFDAAPMMTQEDDEASYARGHQPPRGSMLPTPMENDDSLGAPIVFAHGGDGHNQQGEDLVGDDGPEWDDQPHPQRFHQTASRFTNDPRSLPSPDNNFNGNMPNPSQHHLHNFNVDPRFFQDESEEFPVGGGQIPWHHDGQKLEGINRKVSAAVNDPRYRPNQRGQKSQRNSPYPPNHQRPSSELHHQGRSRQPAQSSIASTQFPQQAHVRHVKPAKVKPVLFSADVFSNFATPLQQINMQVLWKETHNHFDGMRSQVKGDELPRVLHSLGEHANKTHTAVVEMQRFIQGVAQQHDTLKSTVSASVTTLQFRTTLYERAKEETTRRSQKAQSWKAKQLKM